MWGGGGGDFFLVSFEVLQFRTALIPIRCVSGAAFGSQKTGQLLRNFFLKLE